MVQTRKQNRGIVFIPLIVSLLIASAVLGGTPRWFDRLIYIGYLIGVVFTVFNINRVDFRFLLFILFLPLTILISAPDSVFRSWERLGLFIIMYFSCVPVVRSQKLVLFRKQALVFILDVFIVITFASFICYFLNINLFEDRYYGGYLTDYEETAGHFSGITKHSMILGPIAGLAMIYLLSLYIKQRRIVVLFALFLCFITLLFAASRGALIATIGGIVLSFLTLMNKTRRGLRAIVLVITLLAISFPLYKASLSSVLSKHENTELGRFDSRSGKFDARITEFKENPIFGIGFSAVDINGKDEFNTITGTIEPGSSWLALLSMTGIFGFILFLMLFLKSYKNVRSSHDFLGLTLLLFFSIHMLVEGYIFSSGNSLSGVLWLTIGYCYECESTGVTI